MADYVDPIIASLARLNNGRPPALTMDQLYAPINKVGKGDLPAYTVEQPQIDQIGEFIKQLPPQSPFPSGGIADQTVRQMAKDKQESKAPDMLMQILAERMQPNMTDTARSMRQTAQSYAFPNLYKPLSSEQAAQERVQNELAPYTTMLGIDQAQAAIAQKNAMAQQGPGGATGYNVERAMRDPAFADALYNYQTGWRQNLQKDQNGNVTSVPGAPEALGRLAAGKAGPEERAKLLQKQEIEPLIEEGKAKKKASVELETKPEIEKRTETAKGTAKKSLELESEIALIDEFEESAARMKDVLSKTEYTGPVMGLIGDITKEPSRTDLVSAQNELSLQAKSLLKFPSNNFSEADRSFLVDIAGGKYGRAGGLNATAVRLQGIAKGQKARLQHRMQTINSGEAPSNDPLGIR